MSRSLPCISVAVSSTEPHAGSSPREPWSVGYCYSSASASHSPISLRLWYCLCVCGLVGGTKLKVHYVIVMM